MGRWCLLRTPPHSAAPVGHSTQRCLTTQRQEEWEEIGSSAQIFTTHYLSLSGAEHTYNNYTVGVFSNVDT